MVLSTTGAYEFRVPFSQLINDVTIPDATSKTVLRGWQGRAEHCPNHLPSFWMLGRGPSAVVKTQHCYIPWAVMENTYIKMHDISVRPISKHLGIGVQPTQRK